MSCTLGVRRRKPAAGKYTKPNIWDEACQLEIIRDGEPLDPGVNYFVLMLEQLGLATEFSCEGHPNDFYIMFFAPYEAALDIKSAGYFTVEIEGMERWSLRLSYRLKTSGERVDRFRWAAGAWEKRFGPLNFEAVV